MPLCCDIVLILGGNISLVDKILFAMRRSLSALWIVAVGLRVFTQLKVIQRMTIALVTKVWKSTVMFQMFLIFHGSKSEFSNSKGESTSVVIRVKIT